jgi:hypothetical protein
MKRKYSINRKASQDSPDRGLGVGGSAWRGAARGRLTTVVDVDGGGGLSMSRDMATSDGQ